MTVQVAETGLRSGQVAQLAGVNLQTLRDYERRGAVTAGCTDLIACEGESVVGRYTCSGTHTGTWRGHPPTGRRFEQIDEVGIYRVADTTRIMKEIIGRGLGISARGPGPDQCLGATRPDS